MKEKIIGLIPSRMRSSRFPGKAIYNIAGKPMVCMVYDQAKKCQLIDELYVVTPDEEIKKVCDDYNIPFLSEDTPCSSAAQSLAFQSNNLDGTIYLNIQGDEPLLEPESLTQIIQELITNEEEYYVGLYTLIKNEADFKNRNIVKVVLDNFNHAMYFSRSPIPETFEYGSSLRVMGLYGYRDWMLKKYANVEKSQIEKLESGIEMLRMLQRNIKIKFLKTDIETIGVDLPEHIQLVEDKLKKLKRD